MGINSLVSVSMYGRSRLISPPPIAAILSCLILSACANNVQPAVAQFGQAATTSVTAENALFDAIDQRKADAQDLCVQSSNYIDIGGDNQITPIGVRCQSVGDPGGTKEIPADVRKAIDGVLSAVQAYGQALQGLAGDTAATTFNSNADSLGKSLIGFNTNVLAPLGAKGVVTQAQVNAVGQAVKDVGDALIALAISKDVQSAAKRAQQPLREITATLIQVNEHWTEKIPTQLTNEMSSFVIALWRKGDFSDRQALTAIWKKASTPITPDAANKALNSLVTANDQVATAGPDLSIAEIKTAWQAASDAYAAYKALTGK